VIQYRQVHGVRGALPLTAGAEPERVCDRCGVALRAQESPIACDDCRFILSYRPIGQSRRGAGRPDPAFEITLHDTATSLYASPTKHAINQAGYPITESAMDEDPCAHHYVTDVLGHHAWPVVTITSYGRLVTSLEGWRPELIDGLGELRDMLETRAA
jgi:hypothetical protein